VATLVEVVEHLAPAELDDVVQLTIERLRPGGKLILTTPNYGSAWPLVQVLVNRFGELNYNAQHINRFTARRLKRLLEELGLEEVRVKPYLALASFAAALGWRLPDVVSHVEHGPLERTARLLLLGTGTKPGD
jgi:2-polyprenyl-3-methyl-5-hydroxy-6-metoxy-1,4-benzoquinol methylase